MHDDMEEEAEDMSDEDKVKMGKMKVLIGKVKDLQAEAIDIQLDPEDREKIENKIKTLFKENGITFSLPYLHAFQEGLEFGIYKSQMSMEMAVAVNVVLTKMVETRRKAMEASKPVISE